MNNHHTKIGTNFCFETCFGIFFEMCLKYDLFKYILKSVWDCVSDVCGQCVDRGGGRACTLSSCPCFFFLAARSLAFGGGAHVLPLVLALRQRDVERLVAEQVAVHLRDRLGGLLGRAEAHEAEALAAARHRVSIAHRAGASLNSCASRRLSD